MKGHRVRNPIAIFLIFGCWALVLTYPLARQPFNHIPLGDEGAATVPLFNLWTLQWNIDQLVQGYANYWDAPIFAPTSGAFAFSETQPLSALLAAPIWLGFGSPALAYNFLILLFLTLDGWFAYWLLKNWGVSSLPALLAGLLTQSLPVVAQEMGVLQLAATFGLLWSLLFLTRVLAEGEKTAWQNGLCLALGTPVTFFTCAYYGLFSLLFLPLAFLIHLRSRHFNRKTLGRLAAIGLLALALTGPFLWAQRQRLETYGFVRSAQTVTNQSARPESYANFLDHNLVYRRLLGLQSGRWQRLFPGFGLILLAVAGLFGRPKRARAYLLAAILLAFGLSFGLRLGLGGFRPYQLIRDYVPGFAQLRSPFRFAALVQLHLALLAGFGLHHLNFLVSKIWPSPPGPLSHASRWERGSRASDGGEGIFKGVRTSREFRTSAHLVLILVAALPLLESLALPLPLVEIPPLQPDAAWQTWLNAQPRPPRVVLLPFARSGRVADFEQTVRWMLDSHYFRAEMLNGYSGFFPPYHSRLRETMLAFPSADSLNLLREWGVDYVVVHHRLANAPSAAVVEQHLRLLYRDEQSGVAIYGLKQGAK